MTSAQKATTYGWKRRGYTLVFTSLPLFPCSKLTFFQNNDDAKIILANAVQHVGQSVKIWLAAAELEHDVKSKKRVLRKGLVSLCLNDCNTHNVAFSP